MEIKTLIEWSDANKIVEKTVLGFQNYLENWKKENRMTFILLLEENLI